MVFELPILKKGCFCMSLQSALILCAVLKLINAAIGTTLVAMDLYWNFSKYDTEFRVLFGLLFSLALTDLFLTIMMLMAVCMRNINLLKMSYYYTIGATVLSSIMSGSFVAWHIYEFNVSTIETGATVIIHIIIRHIATAILVLMFQFYMFLMIRSLIREVTGNINFRLTKTDTDFQCLLLMENKATNNLASVKLNC